MLLVVLDLVHDTCQMVLQLACSPQKAHANYDASNHNRRKQTIPVGFKPRGFHGSARGAYRTRPIPNTRARLWCSAFSFVEAGLGAHRQVAKGSIPSSRARAVAWGVANAVGAVTSRVSKVLRRSPRIQAQRCLAVSAHPITNTRAKVGRHTRGSVQTRDLVAYRDIACSAIPSIRARAVVRSIAVTPEAAVSAAKGLGTIVTLPFIHTRARVDVRAVSPIRAVLGAGSNASFRQMTDFTTCTVGISADGNCAVGTHPTICAVARVWSDACGTI
mmetsp:Transcript_4515/g.8815  ORF Transcript_4515/g.8815 Transcript_4515/m.8815 type:complete len:274 (-) Transcript_4515:1750-2571(-)